MAALLTATRDASRYVRDLAAMALARARSWTRSLVARLEERQQQGDPDENVARKLEQAYLQVLRREPHAADRLLAIVLRREGPVRWRQALREGPPVDPVVARALLTHLERVPWETWARPPHRASQKVENGQQSGSEDPSPLVLLRALVPGDLLAPWLIQQALHRTTAPLPMRLYVIVQANSIPPALQQAVQRLWIEAIQAVEVPELYALLDRLGFSGIRALIDSLWHAPDALKRAWRLLTQPEAARILPMPQRTDLPWLEARLAALPPGDQDSRLQVLVDLGRLYELGNDPGLRQAVFQTQIPRLLLRYLSNPVTCQWVAIALANLYGRWMPPRCP
ncbi:hypothetical protein [Rhodothermus profundi]|uniref:hypothetical protein n=1 Tax=Rhodothermus profundi TaxID=633813 RepID=UPI001160BF86|nr:hypothetical protein [Rhodothermus profundi]